MKVVGINFNSVSDGSRSKIPLILVTLRSNKELSYTGILEYLGFHLDLPKLIETSFYLPKNFLVMISARVLKKIPQNESI